MSTDVTEMPVWLITGCSTGLGREFARAALAHGFRVAATARDSRSIADLVDGREGEAIALKLDVTDPGEIAVAVAEAERTFGHIDVLVNNAGYGYAAAVEEGDDAEVRAQFETNVFGLASMIRAVLPGMRARGQGAIVNVASVGGLRGGAGGGYYCASKFAVVGLSESLAHEIEPLGLRVMIVEPGPFRTDWAGRSMKGPARSIPAYDATAGRRRRDIAGYAGAQPGDPARAAEAVIRALHSPLPPRHLVLGRVGLGLARDQLHGMLREFDAWEAASLSADFPVEAVR